MRLRLLRAILSLRWESRQMANWSSSMQMGKVYGRSAMNSPAGSLHPRSLKQMTAVSFWQVS